jgi:hypothetical protein
VKHPYHIALHLDVVVAAESYEAAASKFEQMAKTLVSRMLNEGQYEITAVRSLKHLSELSQTWDKNSVPINLNRAMTLGDLLPEDDS